MKIRPKEPKREIVKLFISFLFTSGSDEDLSAALPSSPHTSAPAAAAWVLLCITPPKPLFVPLARAEA